MEGIMSFLMQTMLEAERASVWEYMQAILREEGLRRRRRPVRRMRGEDLRRLRMIRHAGRPYTPNAGRRFRPGRQSR
jgi:hypothetical protein